NQRCSRPLYSSQATDDPTPSTHNRHQQAGRTQQPTTPTRSGSLPGSPTVCPHHTTQHPQTTTGTKQTRQGKFCSNQCSTQEQPPPGHSPRQMAPPTHPTKQQGTRVSLVKLLRKEVIQPHLPVRLPCYDFVPIASPTFDSSPQQGLGHRLRVLPTFMT